MVGLNYVVGFFQDQGFHDSMQTLNSGDEVSHLFLTAQVLAC